MKKAFVVTINEGYMFALNCAFNANKFFGTNADFHVLYHHETPEEYRTACTKAFAPYFKIVWKHQCIGLASLIDSTTKILSHNITHNIISCFGGQYGINYIIDISAYNRWVFNMIFTASYRLAKILIFCK